jgi:hypothetical protein
MNYNFVETGTRAVERIEQVELYAARKIVRIEEARTCVPR